MKCDDFSEFSLTTYEPDNGKTSSSVVHCDELPDTETLCEQDAYICFFFFFFFFEWEEIWGKKNKTV